MTRVDATRAEWSAAIAPLVPLCLYDEDLTEALCLLISAAAKHIQAGPREGEEPDPIPEIQHAAPPAVMPDASSRLRAVEALPDPSEAVTPPTSLPGAAEGGSIKALKVPA